MKKLMTLQMTLCIVGILLVKTIGAQSYHNLLSTGYSYSSPNSLLKNQTIENFYFRASLPLKLRKNQYLLLNPDLHKQTMAFQPGVNTECHKIGLSLAYLKPTGTGNVIGLLNFSNNYISNKTGISSLQYGAGILVAKKYNSEFKLKYGIYANKEFFGVLIVPLIGLDYKIKNKTRLFGILPQNLKLEYKFNKHLRSGLLFETPLNTYRLINGNMYLDQRQILLGVFQDIYLGKNLVAQLSIKQPVSNQQRQFKNDQIYNMSVLGIGFGGKRAGDASVIKSVKHGVILELSLNYRLELE